MNDSWVHQPSSNRPGDPTSIAKNHKEAPLLEGKAESSEETPDNDSGAPPAKRPRRLAWAHLMRRVLDIDVLTCPKCAASMVIIAFLTDPSVLTRILDHLKLPSSSPPPAPARSRIDEQDLFAEDEPSLRMDTIKGNATHVMGGRRPGPLHDAGGLGYKTTKC